MAETRAKGSARQGPASEESLMLDHLRRIERARNGCCAVHFHLSRLQTPYRKPKFIRIAARSFDTLVNNADATLYVLSNSDMALICRGVRVEDIDTAAFKLRALFAEDPLASDDGEDRFTTWYDLGEMADYTSFEELTIRLEADGARHLANAAQNRSSLAPLDANALTEVDRRLQGVRVGEILNSQPCVDVRLGSGRSILFREHYVPMSELARRVAPDVDLFASAWLFNYVTDFLDGRVLAVMGQTDFAELTDPISMNLHVSTVLSPEFQLFNDQIHPHADKVIIEVQMIDVIADMGAFNYAKKWLQQQGYRILIDGLYPLALQYFDPGVLEPDFVKIAWSPDLAADFPDAQLDELRDLIEYTGAARMVLARVETEEAVRWGLHLGIHRFQGFFVDKLVDAMAAKGLL